MSTRRPPRGIYADNREVAAAEERDSAGRFGHGSGVRRPEPFVSHAGLVPAVAMAGKAGLVELADRHLTVAGGPGHAAGLNVSALVAGMVAGADSIADMAVLRHGGMGRLFSGVRAPTTLGTFLRALKFGHVRQLDAVAARFLTGLTGHGGLIDTAATLTYLHVDDTIRRTYGYAKQGSGYGYSGVKGLNALLATVSSADRAPVIVATRFRKGSANSARGAARLVADRGETIKTCGVGGTVVLRADSAYYGADVVAAGRRGGSISRSLPARTAPSRLWSLRFPPTGGRRSATPERSSKGTGSVGVRRRGRRDSIHRFASRGKKGQVTARLIVCTGSRRNPAHVITGEQGELCPVWRHRAVFTNSPLP